MGSASHHFQGIGVMEIPMDRFHANPIDNFLMRKIQNRYSGPTPQITMLLAALGLLVMLGCSQENGDGTVLILELDNSENVHQYWVFNPYNRTIEKCQETAGQAIAQILASNAVPKDSRVKSWRCSFTPPESGG